MAAPKVLNLPTEIQLIFEVMPCQALRRTYEPGGQPHPCAYFGEWGAYHSSDYADAGPPPAPGIVQPMVYAGKTSLLPEILAGCRKAPILAVGINPNLPGWRPKTRNAVNPLFEDFLQYAHYFRYRSISKLQIPRPRYDELKGDVIADGAVYLRSGEIVAVRSAADPAPNGFANAPVLTTEGTIYPGLLDLHNHLVYNVATLWNVPRAFKNRDQWQRHTSYRENLTLPMGVLAQHPATVPPLVRYVETKALLGGTTSVQGMRSKFHGATKLFTGSVRNFEENLLHATERQVRLVVVAGFPRHGDAEALNRFGPAVAEGEDLLVGGRAKRLYLEHPKSTLKIGFDAARAKLEDYAGRLHELDAEIQAGAFTLSAAEEEDFSLLLDNDDYPPAEPGEIELLAAELTLPESIPIDPPTVVDDAEHFARLAAIAHRPAWLDALAAFYA